MCVLKQKVKKAAAKRIQIKKGCFKRKYAYKSHLLRHKTAKQLRRLSSKTLINKADIPAFERMLFFKII